MLLHLAELIHAVQRVNHFPSVKMTTVMMISELEEK
jgi:hypothetical protein